MEHFEILMKVYNTLFLISTKGEETVLMAQCLMALKDVLSKLQENTNMSSED